MDPARVDPTFRHLFADEAPTAPPAVDLYEPIGPATLRAILSGTIPQARVTVIADPREEAEWFHAQALDDPGGDARYRLLRPTHVDAAVARAARAGVTFACAQLGVRPPTLAFFRREGPAEAWWRSEFGGADWASYRGASGRLGHASAALHGIAVSADATPLLACEVAAHEVAHLGRPEWVERDVRAYGRFASDVLSVTGRVGRVVHPDRHEAEPGDVQITAAGEVLWNLGGRGEPDWQRPYVKCPVPIEEGM